MFALPPDERPRPRNGAIAVLGTVCAAETSGPGMLWNAALNCVSKGSGYDPCSLICVRNFGAMLQNRWLGAELTTPAWVVLLLTGTVTMFARASQLLIAARPVVRPPCRRTPLRRRALTVR